MIRMKKYKEKNLKNPICLWIIGCIFSTVLMTGCVTTNTGASQKSKVDTEKVMENRLQLALELHDVWALLYQREMELEAAESHYKKALSYDPTFTRGRNNYGLFLMRLNRIEEAHQQFVKGSEDLGYPKRAELLYKVGLTALKLDRVQEAEDAFTKAAILSPQMAMAYLELAEIAYKRGDNSRSKQLLDKYNTTKSNASPRGLWLGIRLENSFGNQDAEASQGMALRNLYPNSQENLEYQSWLKNERKNP